MFSSHKWLDSAQEFLEFEKESGTYDDDSKYIELRHKEIRDFERINSRCYFCRVPFECEVDSDGDALWSKSCEC